MSIRRLLVALAVLGVSAGALAPVGLAAPPAGASVDGAITGAGHVSDAAAGPRPATNADARPALPAVPTGWPSDPARARARRRSGRRRRPARQRPVRLPLPVPRRRREHRQRLGDLEHERPVRVVLHRRLGREPRHAGLPVLHAPPVEPGDRLERIREGPLEPGQPHHDGGLLQRPPAVLRPGRRPRPRSSSTSSPTCGATSSRPPGRPTTRRRSRPRSRAPATRPWHGPAEHGRRVRPGRSSGCATSSRRT